MGIFNKKNSAPHFVKIEGVLNKDYHSIRESEDVSVLYWKESGRAQISAIKRVIKSEEEEEKNPSSWFTSRIVSCTNDGNLLQLRTLSGNTVEVLVSETDVEAFVQAVNTLRQNEKIYA